MEGNWVRSLHSAASGDRPSHYLGLLLDTAPSALKIAFAVASSVDPRPHADTPPMPPSSSTFRGNKAALPSKPCANCDRPMTWRRRWARCWDEVKFCSDACRRAKTVRG